MSHFSGPYFGGSEVVELGEASSGANRERAINAIRAICEEGPFYRVSYDGSTASIGDAVQAASIEANEVRSQSRADRRRWIREERVGVRDLAPDAELLVDVIDAVRLLSIRQRAVVYLTYWLGMRAEEVARTLDVSPRTVERELTSARGRLEVLLR